MNIQQAKILVLLKQTDRLNRHTYWVAEKVNCSVTQISNQLKILEAIGYVKSYKSSGTRRTFWEPTTEGFINAKDFLSIEAQK